MQNKKSSELITNRKAFHDYEILETYEAGIVLMGTEIKSLRESGGSLQEAYILVSGDEVFLKSCSIPPYRFGNIYNHEEKRERKLLLHKREIQQIKKQTEEKGLTVIPLSFYLKNGFVKVKIAVARGKKEYDKRSAIKAREHKKSIDRAIKGMQD